MRRLVVVLLALVAGILFTGCGAPPNSLTVYTSPKDARVFLDGQEIGSNVMGYKLEFVKAGDGYAPKTVYATAPNHKESAKVAVNFNPAGGDQTVCLALDGIANVRVTSTAANLTATLQGKSGAGTAEKSDITLRGINFPRVGAFTGPGNEPAYAAQNVMVTGAGYKVSAVPAAFDPSGEVLLPNVMLIPVSMVETVDCFLERKELVNPFFELKTRAAWGMVRGTDDKAQVVTNSGSKFPYFGLTAAVNDGKNYVIYSVLHEYTKGAEKLLAAHLEMVATDGGVVTVIGDPSFKAGAEIFLMPCWDPNKRRVYFTRGHVGDVPTPYSINSQSLDEAFNQKEKWGPTTSYLWPDIKPTGGKQIVYTFCDAGGTIHLGKEDIDKPSQQAMVEFAGQPKFAPSGSTIAYILRKYDDNTGKEKAMLYTKDIDGDKYTATFYPSTLFLYKNKVSQIFPRETDPKAPQTEVKDVAWVDEDHIVFASNYESIGDNTPNFDVYYMDVSKGTSPKRLTRNASIDDYPVVLGDYIYFRSNRKGSWNIWKVPKPTENE
ncbi:MAG TPA: hypothetical protein VL860_06530 [Planctomycetota bacterium]|nr:hypothetical protein [Planctomycetota bacterium]